MMFVQKRIGRVVAWGLVLVVSLVVTDASLVAQEVKKENPAGENPAVEKPAARAYQSKVKEWKDLLQKLGELRIKYQSAKGAEIQQIRRQWALTVKEGDQLLDSLREAALAAFVESPNKDRQLTRFLVKMLKDALAQDRHEIVSKMALTLIQHECEDRGVFDLAGHASFALNDFESAKKYLREAELKNSITDIGRNFQQDADDYIKFWKTEQEIRKREAAADDLPRVKLTTTQGEIVVELFENEAPNTVGNFVNLVEIGFYDNKVFHRVLKNFVAQTGCPKGNGTGDAGYRIYCECVRKDYRKHFRGSLSMAHAGPDTGGSQFFITFRATPNLNGRHTNFGRVLTGFDTLVKLQRIDPDGPEGRQVEPDKIIKAEVLRKRDHVYKPEKVK